MATQLPRTPQFREDSLRVGSRSIKAPVIYDECGVSINYQS